VVATTADAAFAEQLAGAMGWHRHWDRFAVPVD